MGLAGPVWLPWCFACSGAPAKASFRFILEPVLGALELKDEETVRRKQEARERKARSQKEPAARARRRSKMPGSCVLKLASSRFRKKRYAVEAACWAPPPSFSDIAF